MQRGFIHKGVVLFKLKLYPCPRCGEIDAVKYLGIDMQERYRVYQCSNSIYHTTKLDFQFVFLAVNRLSSYSLEPNALIKCPECDQSDTIRLNGQEEVSFYCINKTAHADRKNKRFRVDYPVVQKTLKNFIIDELDQDIYKKLHAIYTKSKSIKQNLLEEDLVHQCLLIGLNETIISKIFGSSQPTVNRFIHNSEKLYKHKNKYYVQQKDKTIKKRLFNTELLIDYRFSPIG